jgi:hypothetical protein
MSEADLLAAIPPATPTARRLEIADIPGAAHDRSIVIMLAGGDCWWATWD